MPTHGTLHPDEAGRSTPPALRIVVTGGIGAGKSTVSALLEARGAVVLEADRIGHEVLRSPHPAAAEVSRRWPDAVGDDGVVDRGRLASVVFSNPEALRELESITHPAIADELRNRAVAAGDVPVVVEVPILAPWFDASWWWIAVLAEVGTRLDRAVSRGTQRPDAARRMASQPANDRYAAAADFVIVNDGDLADLGGRVDEIWTTLHGD